MQSTLNFVSAQQIAGRAACNQYFGSVEVKDGAPHLKPAGTTRMACPPIVMEQETRFLNALGAVSTLRFDAGKLLLIDESGRVRMRMAPMPAGAGASVRMPGLLAVLSVPPSSEVKYVRGEEETCFDRSWRLREAGQAIVETGDAPIPFGLQTTTSSEPSLLA